MKKMMMAVAGLAMAVVLTGCGGSPKGVAEDFAEAVAKRESDKAWELTYGSAVGVTADAEKAQKEAIDALGKKIDDSKLGAESFNEVIQVPPEDSGYKMVNGAKVTQDRAEVTVQFVKGKDKKSQGMKVELRKVDGKWKVADYDMVDGLETK